MHDAYFGLKENPFSLFMEQRYLSLREQHRDALNCLIYSINGKSFVLLSGDQHEGKQCLPQLTRHFHQKHLFPDARKLIERFHYFIAKIPFFCIREN